MQYFLNLVGLQDLTLSDIKNLNQVKKNLKDKELEDDPKFERQEKRSNKIITLIKNNVKCKVYIAYICPVIHNIGFSL